MCSVRFPPMEARTQGLHVDLPETATPKDCLDLFFDDDVWEMLVEMTNSKHHKGVWQPVDSPEMQAFVGLTIVTGITGSARSYVICT